MNTRSKPKIIFENESLVIAEKPTGVTTMGSKGEDSLFSRILGNNPRQKLFAVHRLDKATSGLVIFAKDFRSSDILHDLFKKRKVYKEYIALTENTIKELFNPETWKEEDRKFLKIIKENGTTWLEINLPIFGVKTKSRVDFQKGSPACTRISIQQVGPKYALVQVKPKTGRFHQIRCHLSYLNFPILGDDLYRGKKRRDRLYLHSNALQFTWPNPSKKMNFSTKMPEDFKKTLFETNSPEAI